MAAQVSKLRLVHSRDLPKYPKVRDTTRPYRLWEGGATKGMRWRCYASVGAADDRAAVLITHATDNSVIEVVNIRYGRWMATFKRHADGRISVYRRVEGKEQPK